MNKTTKKSIGFLVIILVVVLLALPKLKTIWADSPKKENTSGNKNTNSGVPVSGLIVRVDTVASNLSIAGEVLPDEQVELRPETSGRVTAINFKEGSAVKKGQLLVKINDAELQAQLSKLISDKKTAKARFERSEKLLSKEAISREEYEAIENEVYSIDANIKNLKAQIAKASIYAPFDGTIGLRYISEGSYVTPQTKISDITRISPVKIQFAIPERYSDKIKKGMQISFFTQSSLTPYHATVYATEPHIDAISRSLQMRALYPNKKNEILPGTYVQVKLSLQEDRNVILIPTEALVPTANKNFVYLNKNGKAQPQDVITGIRTDSEVQILGGLNSGDSVITTGIIQLHPGTPINFSIRQQ